MNRQNDLPPFMFEDSIHTGVVMACFDAFCQTLTKKTVVVIDKASIHTSEDFEDRIPSWKKKGLIIKYLPVLPRCLHDCLAITRLIGCVARGRSPSDGAC